jgi:hypothetical protein
MVRPRRHMARTSARQAVYSKGMTPRPHEAITAAARRGYVWYRRYQAYGVEGLRDRSKRPLVSPRAVPGSGTPSGLPVPGRYQLPLG